MQVPRRRLPRAALVRARRAAPGAAVARKADTRATPATASGRPWRLDDFVAGGEALIARLGSGPGRDPGSNRVAEPTVLPGLSR